MEFETARSRKRFAPIFRLLQRNLIERELILCVYKFSLFDGHTMVDACSRGKLQVVQYLRNLGQILTDYAQRAAIKNGHIRLVEYFLQERLGSPSWLIAAASGNQGEIVTLLLARGFTVDSNVMRASVYSRNVELVRRLAAHCPPSPHCLECAALIGEMDTVRFFVEECGIEVSLYALCHAKSNVLRYFVLELELPVPDAVFVAAAKFGYAENLQFFVEQQYDFPPLLLRHASRNGNLEVARILISNRVESVHEGDDYALRWAARMGHEEMVQYFLSCGALASACNYYAERHARMYGHGNIVSLLKQAAQKNKRRQKGVAISFS